MDFAGFKPVAGHSVSRVGSTPIRSRQVLLTTVLLTKPRTSGNMWGNGFGLMQAIRLGQRSSEGDCARSDSMGGVKQ